MNYILKKLHLNRFDLQIGVWIFLQSIILIAAALFSSLVVQLGAVFLFGDHSNFTLGYFLGLIIPFSLVLGIVNSYLVKITYNYFTTLTQAIKKVADGDFNTRIDEHTGGPFRSVYKDFNKMTSELDHVNILKSDFINSYSHEFKTPIVSIKGFADLLLDHGVEEQERNLYLNIISEEAERLSNLTSSILLLSNLDSQEILTNKKYYALDEQVRTCCILLSKEWQEKEIDVQSDLHQVRYYGNSSIVQHLLLNLIANAIKYTPRNGCILLTLTSDNDSIYFGCKDSGIGMDKDSLEHIFDRYYQVSNQTNRQGLGLGLSIVHRIVELCEGNIRVESIPQNGSCFTVILPLTTEAQRIHKQ